ncbi:Zinc RING-type [Cordyceps militaris]|uniref:Zinc RING-type n=1 Tax=Cordyceps militaris TaxID=73501 RepID=A0A2H4SJG2_CORMI|nr:Zinc RING-type [Cordyceps militaris]
MSRQEQQQQQLPFGYLSQMESYLSAVTAQPPPAAPPPPTNTNAMTSSAGLPDCFRTLRCDGCEMLFAEAAADEPRWTFPCGHVYCAECMRRARATAARTNVHVLCRRCANIIVRKLDNAPCAHPIPIVSFDARRPGPPPFPERYRLALGQRTGPKCQLCWLVARLQSLSYRAAQRWQVRDWGFPGELFACVQVDRGRIVHGMRNELPEVAVDVDSDVELHRAPIRQELGMLASDICGGLGQYRLRGFARWVRENGVETGNMPVGLRAIVYGEWS